MEALVVDGKQKQGVLKVHHISLLTVVRGIMLNVKIIEAHFKATQNKCIIICVRQGVYATTLSKARDVKKTLFLFPLSSPVCREILKVPTVGPCCFSQYSKCPRVIKLASLFIYKLSHIHHIDDCHRRKSIRANMWSQGGC